MRVGRVSLVIAGVVAALGWCSVALGQGAPRIITGDGADSAVVKRFLLSGTPDGAFFAYTPSFAGGVRVAGGDVNGDGVPDIVTSPGPGASGGETKAFSGTDFSLLHDFLPYPG